MEPTVELVLASTCKFHVGSADYSDNVYTFRFTYPVGSLWRRLLGRTPEARTVYATGFSPRTVAQDVYCEGMTDVMALMALEQVCTHIEAAEETFECIHSSTKKISVELMKRAHKLWGPRLNQVLKSYKVGDCHIPSDDGINLIDHIREATPNGWHKPENP